MIPAKAAYVAAAAVALALLLAAVVMLAICMSRGSAVPCKRTLAEQIILARSAGVSGPVVGREAVNFDMTLFINLNHRTDRLREIQLELSAMDWLEHAQRIEAVSFPSRGSFGCLQSHILALRTFLGDPAARHALILEDDCQFVRDPHPEIRRFLAEEPGWDLLLLGTLKPKTRPHNQYLKRVRFSLATHSYAVSREFALRLLPVWEASVAHFLQLPDSETACDVTWNQLAKQSRWFLLDPVAAVQRQTSSSDIR